MPPERVILCGGLSAPAKSPDAAPIRLNLTDGPKDTRVNLKISDFNRRLPRSVPVLQNDLVEIAAYVYSADQAIVRTGQDTDTFGGKWRQVIHLHIPVRRPDFWSRPEVTKALSDVLGFLADHIFEFTFKKAANPAEFHDYLDFTDSNAGAGNAPIDQVAMFSGGLDSLAGAIEELVTLRNRVAFVTHISTPKNSAFIRQLWTDLQKLSPSNKAVQIAVLANKAKAMGKEHTQRTRSFLFAALGSTVAQMLKLNSLRFYENGVVSINLPVCAQVVGGRATRTTHPRVLAGFSKLFSLICEADFQVVNPFIFETKADVIRRIVRAGAGHLIASSVSCGHTWTRTTEHSQCGVCSQCIDRRLAMLSADAWELDRAARYENNVFINSSPERDDRILLAAYLNRALAMKTITSPTELISRYPEISRAIPYIPGQSQAQVAQRLLDLHRKHGAEVESALAAAVSRHAYELVNDQAAPDCLIRIALENRILASAETASQASPPAPPSYFWRRGNVWEIRFKGGTSFPLQRHDKGCRYLAHLLSHPGATFTGQSVQDICDRAGEVGHIALSAIQDPTETDLHVSKSIDSDALDAADDKKRENYKKALSDLDAEIAKASREHRHGDLAALKTERGELIDGIDRDFNKFGKSRKTSNLAKSRNDAVRINVRRTIDEIRKHDAALADHLSSKKNLRVGAQNSYQPPNTVAWVFTDPTAERVAVGTE
ncbi:MAG: hypothetical protein WC661_06350 [Opitutaceae bacterium]|jgi:hypothetical protein